MTYDYEVVGTDVVVQVEQRITAPALTELTIDGQRVSVRRLISASPGVHFVDGPSGGWSSAGYAKRPHERRAEAKLGRKLIKAAR